MRNRYDMHRMIYLFMLLMCYRSSALAQASPRWQRTMQAGGPDWTLPTDVATDKWGNTVVVGYFIGTTAFNTTTLTSRGQSDIFIAKYSAAGALRWIRTAGGSERDEPYSVVLDNQGTAYVTGGFGGPTATFGTTVVTSQTGGDAFLASYDSVGTLRWLRQANSSTGFTSGYDLAVDSHRNVYWTGIYSGVGNIAGTPVPASATGFGLYLAKLTASGTVRWTRETTGNVGGGGVAFRSHIAVDNQDQLYFTGTMGSGRFTIGSYVFTNRDARLWTDDIFLAKYDSLGTVKWAQQLGGTENDELISVITTPAGNVVLLANFAGTTQVGGAISYELW